MAVYATPLSSAAGTTGNDAYGYEAYLGDLESQYQMMLEAMEAQRAAQLARIQAQYDAAVEQLERQRPSIEQNFENTAREAYTQNMIAKRDLPQQLAAQGMTGGLSESSQLALAAEYGNDLNSARRDRDQQMYDLDTQIGSVRAAGADALAGAEGDYNTLLADVRNNYLANLANTRLQQQLAQMEEKRYQEQLAYQKEQDAISNAFNQAQFDWQKEQADRDYNLSLQRLYDSYSGSSGSAGGTSGDTSGTGGSSFSLNDGNTAAKNQITGYDKNGGTVYKTSGNGASGKGTGSPNIDAIGENLRKTSQTVKNKGKYTYMLQ